MNRLSFLVMALGVAISTPTPTVTARNSDVNYFSPSDNPTPCKLASKKCGGRPTNSRLVESWKACVNSWNYEVSQGNKRRHTHD
jgi:hypothetical protein